jgi:hypothetical protein
MLSKNLTKLGYLGRTNTQNTNIPFYDEGTPSLDLNFAGNRNLVDNVSGNNLVTFTRASSGTFVDSARVIQTAVTDVPRFDHNPTTGESLGLLVEEQRTNLCLHSEDISNAAWVLNGGTATTNTTAAPNGQTTADTFTANLSAVASVHQIITCLASTTYTWSFYVRLGTLPVNDFRIAVRDDTNGAFIAQDVVPNVTPVTTEWRRVVYTFTTPVGCVLVRLYLLRSLVGIGGTVFLWGAQLEAGAFPTSYIPTTTAAATRSADVVSITGSAFSSWYSQSEGTVFVEHFANNLPVALQLFGINNGTATDRAFSPYINGRNYVFDIVTSSVFQASISTQGNSIPLLATSKVAMAAAGNNAGISANGLSPVNDASVTMPVNCSEMQIGRYVPTGAFHNSTIRRLTFWPTRLSNTTLQNITR